MKPSAGEIAVGKGADVGVGKKTARKRAVGTREHIVAYLAEVHELSDASGMASTRLAAAVGYPGSSVAFAQLLSGMERSGLIEREVRGKRTYRISLRLAQAGGVGGGVGTADFDYDELARRLLVQVVRRLAAAEPGTSARTEPGQLAQENVRLREQLEATRESLALAAERLRKLEEAAEPAQLGGRSPR